MQTYSEQELKSLIEDVEREFTSHLAKAESSLKLAKSEDESEKKDESKEEHKDKEPEKKEEKGAEEPKQEESEKEEPKEEHKEEGEEKPSEEMSSEEKPSEEKKPEHGDEEGHDYDEEDMQHLHGMYSSMSKGELKAHHDIIRKCMDGKMMAKCEYSMEKSEKDFAIETKTDEEVTLLKSELEAAKAESGNLKKNLEAVEAFLKKFVEKTAPAGKAITSLDVIAKTEGANKEKPLQKSEIDRQLTEKAKNPSLSKSDRDAINSYYCGSKDIEKVRHLLNQ